MKDEACVHFLQSVLPRLQMRWSGFRRVYGQVCKRLGRRVKELSLNNLEQYQHYVETHKEEWLILDGLCQVTVSRFYRDKMMFNFLANEVFPELARQANKLNKETIKIWCIGCASGEEPYTVNMIWQLQCQSQFPRMQITIVASDANANMLQRMEQACYSYATIKNLPEDWRQLAFTQQDELYYLKATYRKNIQPLQQDIREAVPEDDFDLIFCRNLVCTYYDKDLQCETMARIQQRLRVGGALVLGIHEQLPDGSVGFEPWSAKLRIFRKQHTDV